MVRNEFRLRFGVNSVIVDLGHELKKQKREDMDGGGNMEDMKDMGDKKDIKYMNGKVEDMEDMGDEMRNMMDLDDYCSRPPNAHRKYG